MNSSENLMEEKYKFEKVVGRGASGKVYRAIDKEDGQIVAIKKIEETDQPWEACFHTEIEAFKKIGRHPNIITLKEAMKDDRDNTVYLVFEFMRSDLYNFVNQKNEKGVFIGETQIKKWCFQILRGLDHIHRSRFFHRDIKPQNLLVSESGVQLKIADFGLSRKIDDKSPCGKYVGTRWYNAPEVVFGSINYGPAVDIWAVGAILAELYMGRPIFPANSRGDQVAKICSVIGSPTAADTLSFADVVVKKYQFPNVKSSSLAALMPEDAISLFKLLCSWDPSKRPSASQALKHPFFINCYPIPKHVTCVSSHKPVEQEEQKPTKKSVKPPPDFSPAAKIIPTPFALPHMVIAHNRSKKIAPPPLALPHMIIAHNGSKCY